MSAEKGTSSGPSAKGGADRPHGSKGGAFTSGHFARDSRSSRVVVVGLIGKSRFGKAAVANALLDRPGFRSIPLDDARPSSALSPAPPEPAAIDVFHDTETNVIYLSLVSDRDYTQLFNSISSAPADALSTPEATHAWIHKGEQADLRAALFLFCVCHIILVVQPSPRVEIEWIRCLRVLQMVKEQAGPMLHTLLTTAASSKLLDVNPNHLHSIMAPVKVIPILAFVFDDSSLASLKARKCEGHLPVQHMYTPTPGVMPVYAPAPPKEDKSPLAVMNTKLQQALESQVRMLLKKPKKPAHQRPQFQACSKLFQLDITQAAHVITLCEEEYFSLNTPYLPARVYDFTGAGNFTKIDVLSRVLQDEAGKERLRRWLDAKIEATLNPQVVNSKESSKNRGPYRDLISASAWFSVANFLRERLIYGKENSPELERQLARLHTHLDPELHLSLQICKSALAAARAVYFTDLPAQYPTSIHNSRIELAQRVFHKLARGPSAAQAIEKLVAECEQYWRDGHQRCDAVSVTNRPCVHPVHALPNAQKPSGDATPSLLKTMEHSSGYKSMNSCNCGRSRKIREDPFDIRSANYEFFRADCCINLPSLLQSTPSPSDSNNEESTPARVPSWAMLLITGPAQPLSSKSGAVQPSSTVVNFYNHEKGLMQDGIMSAFSHFMPWDLSISKIKAAAKATSSVTQAAPTQATSVTAPTSSPTTQPRSGKQSDSSRRSNQHGGNRRQRQAEMGSQPQDLVDYLDKAIKEKDIRRVYVGIEYECPMGHRQLASPDLVAAVMGIKSCVKSGRVDVGRLIAENELPLFLQCACNKPGCLAQLQRIYFVTPENPSSLRFVFNPIVQFSIPLELQKSTGALSGANIQPMLFSLGKEVVVSGTEHAVVILRLPYIYATPRKSLIQNGPNTPYKCSLLPNFIKVV